MRLSAETPPAVAPHPVDLDLAPFDAEAWAAVIGPRHTAYYLTRFEEQFRTAKPARWHWPAFFITTYWLLYRKLWGWTALYYVVPSIAAMILSFVLALLFPHNGTVQAAMWIGYWVLLFVVPPLVANPLYYKRCKRILEREAAGVSRERWLARVETKGGTSNLAVILVVLFAIVAVLGVFAAIAIPAYHDYTRRARSAEATGQRLRLADRVGRLYEKNGRFPDEWTPRRAAIG